MLYGLDQPDERRNFRYRPLARQQGFTRSHGAGRSTDDADHLIKICDGDDKAKQEMRPITRLVQFELGAARDDLSAELDERVRSEERRLGKGGVVTGKFRGWP